MIRWRWLARILVWALGLALANGCRAGHVTWVHRELVWPGLSPSFPDAQHERSETTSEKDPLDEAHEQLDKAGISVVDECVVELPVCAALGCPARSVDLFVAIAPPAVSDAVDIGFVVAENGPPKEEDGFRPCEPL